MRRCVAGPRWTARCGVLIRARITSDTNTPCVLPRTAHRTPTTRPHPETSSMSEIEVFAERCELLLVEVERAVVGKRETLELVLLGLLADGHVLIEDYPGLAKTLI